MDKKSARAPASDGSISPTSTTNPEANTMRAAGRSQSDNSSTTGHSNIGPWAKPVIATGLFASNGLRGAASTFKPAEDAMNRKLSLLTLGSTSDNGPIIVSSKPIGKTTQEPIGTKGSGSNSPVRPKAWFSTDVNPDKPAIGTHFLLIEGLKKGDKDGIIAYVEKQYNGEIRGKKIAGHTNEDDTEVDMLLFVDDLRKSGKIIDDLDSVGSLNTRHVGFDWYANGGKVILAIGNEPKSMYVGQVMFSAEFKGRTADIKGEDELFDKVKHFANLVGGLLAFEQNKAALHPLHEFRAEYFKASDAEAVIAACTEPVKLGDHKGWVISAKQYAPPSYGSVIIPPPSSRASTSSSSGPVLPPGATMHTSPTGRTAWYVDSDGNNVPVTVPESAAVQNGHAEMAVTPYREPEHGRFGNGFVARTPHAPQRPYRMDSRNWSIDHGYGDVDEFSHGGSRGQLADVNVDRIIQGYDVRTTVMMRNVPHHFRWQDIHRLLNKAVPNRYNFMYLRIDFQTGKNVGYAFVNFETALDIVLCVKGLVGKPWDPMYPRFANGNAKTVQLSYATIQGLDSLIDKFRNSSVMDEMIDYRPLLLQTPEEFKKENTEAQDLAARGLPVPAITKIGERKIFPASDNRAKKERSTANAAMLGLFTPRNHRPAGERMYRSQYDRGTPAQLMEDAQYHMGNYVPQPYMPGPANYLYSPRNMFTPPMVPGMGPAFPGFSAPPGHSPRTPYGYGTPAPVRHFETGTRPGFHGMHAPMAFGNSPAHWHGPTIAHGGAVFSSPGFPAKSSNGGHVNGHQPEPQLMIEGPSSGRSTG